MYIYCIYISLLMVVQITASMFGDMIYIYTYVYVYIYIYTYTVYMYEQHD